MAARSVFNVDLKPHPDDTGASGVRTETFNCGEMVMRGGKWFQQEVVMTTTGVEVWYYGRSTVDSKIIYPWHRVLEVRELGDGATGLDELR